MIPDYLPDEAISVQPDDVTINPQRLEVFCRVVERQSFTRAAEDLLLTRPAVSMHIRTLEGALGTRLIDRRHRGAPLTEAGRAVYDFAVGVRRDLAVLRAQLRDLAGGQTGVVTFGAPQTVGSYILPELLAEFHQRHPAAQLRSRVLVSHAVAEAVLRGHLDFGIVNQTTGMAPSLRSEPLWTEPMVLIAPPTHRLAKRTCVALADLANESFILGPGRAVGDRVLDEALARAGLPPRRIVLEVGVLEAGKQAVLRNVGLLVAYQRAVTREVAAGTLVALPIEDLPIVGQFHLVWRPGHHFSPLAQRLLAFLRAHKDPAAADGERTRG